MHATLVMNKAMKLMLLFCIKYIFENDIFEASFSKTNHDR